MLVYQDRYSIQMIKSVRIKKFAPSRKELTYSEIADIIQKSVEMSQTFHENYERNVRQQELKRIIDECELPEGQPLVILCYGTTGSGKSVGCLGELTDQMIEFPGVKTLFSRRTYVEIEDSIWPTTQEFFDRYKLPYSSRKGAYEITLANGSRIRMRSAEPSARSKTNKVHGLGSTEYGLAFLEECDEIPQEFLFTVYARMRQKIKGFTRPIILMACNPPSEEHWLYEYFFEDPDNNPYDPKSFKRVLKFKQGDNTQNVREGYESSLRLVLKDDPMLLAAFGDGDFSPDMKGFPVFYKSFNKDLHVSKVPIHKSWDRDKPVFFSMDFGFNTPAILVGQWYPELNQLRGYKTWTGKKILMRPFLTRVLNEIEQMFPNCRLECFCDPHGDAKSHQGVTDETAIKVLKSMGFNPRYKHMSIERGLDVVQDALTDWFPSKFGPQPGILLDPQCKHLIKALEIGYCNDKNAPAGKLSPVKDGVHDHHVDVLRYVMIFKRRTESSGESIDQTTDNGYWRPVANGDPNTWATQMATARNSRIPLEKVLRGGKRRRYGRVSPNLGRNSNW